MPRRDRSVIADSLFLFCFFFFLKSHEGAGRGKRKWKFKTDAFKTVDSFIYYVILYLFMKKTVISICFPKNKGGWQHHVKVISNSFHISLKKYCKNNRNVFLVPLIMKGLFTNQNIQYVLKLKVK